jgi:transcriptional regulator with XRE-family HTH domain
VWIAPREYKLLGAHLAEVRKAAGVTQQEAAKRLKKPQSFVSSYESGQRRLDLLELARVAAALDADLRQLCLDLIDRIAPAPRARKHAARRD